jgi:PAS domain S-box-containing protein
MAALRVLLVDDDPDDRDLVARCLRPDFGEMEITHAHNTATYDAAVSGEPFNIVITDFHLGWSDGLAVLRTVKARWADCPVIMFTGTGNEEIAVEAIKAGLDDYIVKAPRHFSRLSVAVRSILARSRERRELNDAEARIHELFNGVPVGLYRLSPRGDILDANPYLLSLMGISDPNEVHTLNFGDFFVDGLYYAEWLRRLDEQRVVSRFRAQWRRRDGITVWVECGAHVVAERGKIAHYEGSVEDVTDRVRAELEAERSFYQMRRAVDGTVQAISSLSEWRDAYTAGHQQRVAQLAVQIAERMSIDTVQRETVRIAAQLHDIGKVAVPLDILSKPNRLNEYEYGLVRLHPQVGHDILQHINLPWPVAKVVLQHHCRLDGTGYPTGFRGDAISMEARILTVADVVEAMSSHRPYRAALGVDAALREITEHIGSRFDGDVVKVCREIFAEGFVFDDPISLHSLTQ